MMPKGKKRPVKESFEGKLTFKEMIKLVQESGGQQQIDPVDAELFAWAQRVAAAKFNESTKQEVYAGLVYERMGGVFEMYDVLAETK
jgi:iron only hydrogenase large subunit-like protein